MSQARLYQSPKIQMLRHRRDKFRRPSDARELAPCATRLSVMDRLSQISDLVEVGDNRRDKTWRDGLLTRSSGGRQSCTKPTATANPPCFAKEGLAECRRPGRGDIALGSALRPFSDFSPEHSRPSTVKSRAPGGGKTPEMTRFSRFTTYEAYET